MTAVIGRGKKEARRKGAQKWRAKMVTPNASPPILIAKPLLLPPPHPNPYTTAVICRAAQ